MVEHKHVIAHRIIPILSAIIVVAIAFGAYLAFANVSMQTAESKYVEKLNTLVEQMRTLNFQEQQAVQNWKSGATTSGAAFSQLSSLQSQRVQLKENLRLLVPPEPFHDIHQDLVDANQLWIDADSDYVQGVLQDNDDAIKTADGKVKQANQKFNSALESLRTAGYEI